MVMMGLQTHSFAGDPFLGQALHPVGLKNRVLYLLGIRYSV